MKWSAKNGWIMRRVVPFEKNTAVETAVRMLPFILPLKPFLVSSYRIDLPGEAL